MDLPEVLVLGPSDYQCLLQLGVCLYLDQQKYFSNINYYIGVDSGAILSLLLNIGLSPVEIGIELLKFNPLMQDFDFSNLYLKHGVLGQEEIIKFLNNIVKNKFGYVPNLQQLYNITKKELCLVASQINSDIKYVTYKSDPRLSCVNAAVLSYSRPLIFAKMKYLNHEYIGGMLDDPYPVNYFNDGKRQILGIFASPKHHSTNKLLEYLNDIILRPILNIFKLVSENSGENCNHIYISSDKIDLLYTAINLSDKYQIIFNGITSAEKYYLDKYPDFNIKNNTDFPDKNMFN